MNYDIELAVKEQAVYTLCNSLDRIEILLTEVIEEMERNGGIDPRPKLTQLQLEVRTARRKGWSS